MDQLLPDVRRLAQQAWELVLMTSILVACVCLKSRDVTFDSSDQATHTGGLMVTAVDSMRAGGTPWWPRRASRQWS